MKTDNITLALFSLKQLLQGYLDVSGWSGHYSIYIEGDPVLRGKEFVEKVSNPQTQLSLPAIVIEPGLTRNEIEELGDNWGKDVIFVSLTIICSDSNSKFALSHTVRRKLTDCSFDVYNFKEQPTQSIVASALLQNTTVDDLSDADSSLISDRYKMLVNTTMYITAQQLV